MSIARDSKGGESLQAAVATSQNKIPSVTIQDGSALEETKVGGKKPGMRVFLSGANSLLGHSLFEDLRNDHIAI
jgi:hypothetical protein